METYFITHNPHKFEEASDLAKSYNLAVHWKNIEYEEIQENTLETIAQKSCETLLERNVELSDMNFFLEDAGLFINTLNSFPGPYSSYVFKTIGNDGILKLMEDIDDRKALFKSIIAFYSNNEIKLYSGITKGEIIFSKKGKGGFGFDPIFKPEDCNQTFAEMTLTTKNLYSHRQKSLRELFTSLTAFA